MALLCIPCYLSGDTDDEYHIFFVDLSNKDEILEECVPKLRVSSKLNLASFWVKDSTLYMISMSSGRVGTLELSEVLRSPEPVVLKKSMITYIAPMKQRKRFPFIVPVPTLDGKILVMSSSIQSHVQEYEDSLDDLDDSETTEFKFESNSESESDSESNDSESKYNEPVQPEPVFDDDSEPEPEPEPVLDDDSEFDDSESDASLTAYGEIVDFEIYDSKRDCWETLPSIQSYWPDDVRQICRVAWAAFIDPNTLLVKTRDMTGLVSNLDSLAEIRAKKGYLFELDISKGSWKVREGVVLSGLEFASPDVTATAMVNGGELFFNPYEVIDTQHMSGTPSVCGDAFLPFSDQDLENYKHPSRSCLVSCVGDRCYFYVVEAERQRKTKHARLSVGVYCVDIGKYIMEKRELESVWRNDIIEKEKKKIEKVQESKKKYGKKSSKVKKLKLKLRSALLRERLKLGGKPQIDMHLTTSFQFVIRSCKVDCFFPRELSLGRFPASSRSYPGDGKGKRPRHR